MTYPYEGTHRYRSGGGGLCSTVPDYARFLQMMLNGGELDGVRLLSRKTVEMMTTDQLGDLSRDFGFGLGFGVTRNLREGELTSVGAYRWGGYWYTTFFIDPAEKMIGVCMAQISPERQGHAQRPVRGPRPSGDRRLKFEVGCAKCEV